MTKISLLPTDTAPTFTDYIPSLDSETSTTKKLTLQALYNLFFGNTTSAWQSWTPSFTALTVGNGTLSAYYLQNGKTVHFRIYLIFGSTTSLPSATDVYSTLPVNASSNYPNATGGFNPIGQTSFWNGTSQFMGPLLYYQNANPNKVLWNLYSVSGTSIITKAYDTANGLTNATGNIAYAQGFYEAA